MGGDVTADVICFPDLVAEDSLVIGWVSAIDEKGQRFSVNRDQKMMSSHAHSLQAANTLIRDHTAQGYMWVEPVVSVPNASVDDIDMSALI